MLIDIKAFFTNIMTDRPGIIMGQRYTPIEKVGVCVPSSPTAFPSTILMNVIPAKIAGVEEIVLVTPPERDGSISPAALAAARIAGADRIFKLGGAQAVAALAYGTESCLLYTSSPGVLSQQQPVGVWCGNGSVSRQRQPQRFA